MSHRFRVVALISAFNEGDIISPVIGHLVENGVDAYLLDNHSTDDTVEQASRWLGRGLLNIEQFPAIVPGNRQTSDTFQWSEILRRKEELAQELPADWFIHHDADEIREVPWPDVSLRDAIQWVDTLGYNCIDFRVLNFPPVDDGFRSGDDPRTYFTFYEEGADLDWLQLKCWKAGVAPISLAPSGGHEVRFENRSVFPIRFFLRHYPIRGQAHGRKKVFGERKDRFLASEVSRGWHRQYSDIVDETCCFLRDPTALRPFELDRIRLEQMLPETTGPALATALERLRNERDKLIKHGDTLERERDSLKRHAAILEQDRDSLRTHAALLEKNGELLRQQAERLARDRDSLRESLNRRAAELEHDRDSLQRHAAVLERDRDSFQQRAKVLEGDLKSLRQHAANLEQDRDSSRHHAAALDTDRAALQQHAANLENELSSLRQHATALEQEFRPLKQHADLLAQERESLRRHVENIEKDLDSIRQHAAVLEKDCASLKTHAAVLDQDRESLRQHARNVETDRDSLRQHATHLENEREVLRRQVENLEKEIAELRTRVPGP